MISAINQKLNSAVKKHWPDIDLKDINYQIIFQEKEEFGDYSSNIPFLLAAELKKSPREIADVLKNEMIQDKKGIFEKIEVAGGGFLNFYLSRDFLIKELSTLLKEGADYGKENIGKNKKAQVEFISANPTGPLTLGNGRGGFLGDAIANLLEFLGYKAEREYYINDRGRQVDVLGVSILSALGRKIPKQFKKEELYRGDYISGLAKTIKNKNGDMRDFKKTGNLACQYLLKDIKRVAKEKLKINFNKWFSESSLYKKGLDKKILNYLKKKNLIYKKEGAVWFSSKKFGDSEDRVLIKSSGEETYFFSDIIYHYDKFKNRKFSKVIDIWGADHHGYAGRLKNAVSAFGYGDKLEIIITQLVRLAENGKEVRMSKRSGKFYTLEELVDAVSLNVARFFFLARSPGSHMDFDMALAREKSEKNPIYLILYANARIASIFRKYFNREKLPKDQEILKKLSGGKELDLLEVGTEISLIKTLLKYPDIISKMAKNYEIYHLAQYLIEVARALNYFYEKQRVIGDDKNTTRARLRLVLAARVVFKSGLAILGISTPEKM